MLILAFDTATSVATAALMRDRDVLGEAVTTPLRVLEAADRLLAEASADATDLGALVVGVGPGSFTGVRIGLAVARGLALALEIPVAGVSTLDALAEGAPGALPVIDAKRHEVFVRSGDDVVAVPAAAFEAPGRTCVGDGAVRYREQLERTGASVPPDDSDAHVPYARFHASLAETFRAVEEVEPIYVRAPDADRMLA